MRCGWLRCHVVSFEAVVWGELEDDLVIRTTQIYSVLHRTTKYYSSTTLYYTVLLQYYSVLQSTTPVLLRTTQYYSTTTLTKYYSSTILYYKVLLQYPVLLLVLQSTHLQGAEHQRHQRHQLLCLPRKMTFMIDPRHI